MGLPILYKRGLPFTITLNSPADEVSVADTTPTIETTAVDPEGQSVQYQIQIHTNSEFGETADSYSETFHSTSSNLSTTIIAKAQSFTGNGGLVNSAKFLVRKSRYPYGNLVAKIYTHSGVYGSSSLPTGAPLATSLTSIDVTTLSRLNFQSVEFMFSGVNRILLESGTKYVLVIECTNTLNPGHQIEIASDNLSVAHSGNSSQYLTGPSVWVADISADIIFSISTLSLIDKTSDVDAGFLNTVNGGDTDPFNSGQKVSYTVQTTLDTGTYFWRARAKDPSGENRWSDWSDTRSFVVTSSAQVVIIIPHMLSGD